MPTRKKLNNPWNIKRYGEYAYMKKVLLWPNVSIVMYGKYKITCLLKAHTYWIFKNTKSRFIDNLYGVSRYFAIKV